MQVAEQSLCLFRGCSRHRARRLHAGVSQGSIHGRDAAGRSAVEVTFSAEKTQDTRQPPNGKPAGPQTDRSLPYARPQRAQLKIRPRRASLIGRARLRAPAAAANAVPSAAVAKGRNLELGCKFPRPVVQRSGYPSIGGHYFFLRCECIGTTSPKSLTFIRRAAGCRCLL